ncbi:MAG: type II secretion system GspH family protein [Clostridium sp.]|jgi:type IV pilus assembly protein PilA|uniref:type II secretion system protein n=1 Tax=Clostridium sp. TaxID=1506 RepID=UPI0025C4CE57|nr:type II secretion system protein [Clostridium sp.]MCH3964167.1 type II secretion system GspH family protein [Clostridium sp.]MCI1715348.1 type II secretion system GspH family protein [Clostridium sp.]MCI1799861.1 type II secretion system GspH family protein [Clostridium sp.]MCI1813531.1 type II secretion system GspH family protein [Clostridium sp.]MCI1870679.1 type II secretion system GspH family protein [Clostridium sp.]
MKEKRKSIYGGFTLIELLLVVSIILILMGFLVPKFSGYESKVKTTKAINTAKQIQTAAMASYGENDGVFIDQDVKDCIDQLTSAQTVEISEVGDDGKNISISYESDDKNYLVDIDAGKNEYTVDEIVENNSVKRIFPK